MQKRNRDGSRSHNNNIKLELKGKNILNRTVGNSIDKIYYERITVINLHEHKITRKTAGEGKKKE